MHPATNLYAELRTAARAAYLHGASEKQIELIVALARGSGDYNVPSVGHLTKAAASRIIDVMMNDGAEPVFEKTDEELDDRLAIDRQVARDEERRRISKRQKKQEKAERDARQAKYAEDLVGRRVFSKYLGSGLVLSANRRMVSVRLDRTGEVKTSAAVAWNRPIEKLEGEQK